MFKCLCILFTTACILACSHASGDKEQPENSGINLFLGKLQVPLFDSVSVDVSAADMAAIHISRNSLGENINIEGVPEGENRKFKVKVYADAGVLVQEGEATADIKAGEGITIPINLKTLFGFLILEIPLGIINNTGVRSGKLFLNDLEFDMKIENGKGIFNTNSLPLDKEFNMRIELKNAIGEILFTGSKNISLSSILQTETMQSQSTRGSVILELSASSGGSTQGIVTIPSNFRSPENYGDIFFTELYVDPKASGDDFEYLEIYNATIDTLNLSTCRVARNRSTTANTYMFKMPENLILLPAEFLIFGRDSVAGANFNYKGLTLANSEQSLGIFCGNSVIDSIYYSTKTENKFPITRGTAMQLPLANYATRTQGSSWCLGFSPRQDALCK